MGDLIKVNFRANNKKQKNVKNNEDNVLRMEPKVKEKGSWFQNSTPKEDLSVTVWRINNIHRPINEMLSYDEWCNLVEEEKAS
jgi:hypothetical protein